MADDKKRYIGAGLSDDVYYALIKMATYSGRHPTNLIEEYVQRGLIMDAEMHLTEDSNLPVELKVFKHLQEIKLQANNYMMLKQIASSLLSCPDEMKAEHLHALCDLSGVSFETVMKEVQETSLSVKSAMSFEDDNSVAQAKTFLMDIFKDVVELKANDIYDMGSERGFTKASLRDAKTELGVMSVRRSKSWVWQMPYSMKIPSSVEVSYGK